MGIHHQHMWRPNRDNYKWYLPGEWCRPSIWEVLSSPFLDIQKEKGFGFYFFMPISKAELKFVSGSINGTVYALPRPHLADATDG